MKKIKNLNYLSYREVENLDNIEVLYTDGKPEYNKPNVYMKKYTAGKYEIDNLNEIDFVDWIEKLFINKVRALLNDQEEHYIHIDKKIISTLISNNKSINLPKLIIEKFLKDAPHPTGNESDRNYFVMIPKKMEKEFISLACDHVFITISNHLEDEIIFGVKNGADEPGLVFLSNDEGLSDTKNIRFIMADLGFFPHNCYYIIKIH